MKIFYLVTLCIIGTTANVVKRKLKGCECDDFTNDGGWGNCIKKESDDRTMCYIKNPSTSTCPDKKPSTTDVGKMWSYKACETNNKPTTSKYVLSPKNGLCDDIKDSTKSFSLLSTEEECRKAVAVIKLTVKGANFVTDEDEENWPRGCYLYTVSNGVYFNIDQEGDKHKSAQQICIEGTPSGDCKRDSDCSGEESCQGGKCGCGDQKSCVGDKAAPTCDADRDGGTCICGRNDLDGDGVFEDPVLTCATQAASPTCYQNGIFECGCGSEGPCKEAGNEDSQNSICLNVGVNKKETCVLIGTCDGACSEREECDARHQVCRCGTSATCSDFIRGPSCDNVNSRCMCNFVADGNADNVDPCDAGEICVVNAAGVGACRCGDNDVSCGDSGQCIDGECRCGNVGHPGCQGGTPNCVNGECAAA